jgi:uncharacterized protein
VTLWSVVAADAPLWRSRLHGELHANRVAATGLELARRTVGADPLVVFLFGLFHDCRRKDEAADPRHGERAATYLELLHAGGEVAADNRRIEMLLPIIRDHSRTVTSDDPTVGCCFDADRLNLQRLGITPKPALLSTAAAADLIDWTRDNEDTFVAWPALADAAGYR